MKIVHFKFRYTEEQYDNFLANFISFCNQNLSNMPIFINEVINEVNYINGLIIKINKKDYSILKIMYSDVINVQIRNKIT